MSAEILSNNRNVEQSCYFLFFFSFFHVEKHKGGSKKCHQQPNRSDRVVLGNATVETSKHEQIYKKKENKPRMRWCLNAGYVN